MIAFLLKTKFGLFILFYYLFLFGWWLKILLSGQQTGSENYFFGTVYPILALIGGINGLMVSRIYGGLKSVMGRGIIFLSLALLGQVFGQFAWSYFNVVAQIEVPYPSIADIGYFAVIPFNILAMLAFAKAAGVNFFSIKTYSRSLPALVIPIVMVVIAYFLFMTDYEVDFSDPIRVFLDFGYPLGEAIYISLAILTYFYSRKLLGGVMRNKILFLVFAFIVQFTTDYTFLFRASRELYYNAGPVDLMYATSFAIYSLALLSLKYIRTQD